MATPLTESFNLDLNDVTYVEVSVQLVGWHFVKNDTWYSNIETAVNTNLLVVFNERLDDHSWFNLDNFFDMSVDKSVFLTLLSLAHDLFENCHLSLINIGILIKSMVCLAVKVLLHLSINHWQVKYILRCIFEHFWWKGPSLPKFIILHHILLNVFFLGVLDS